MTMRERSDYNGSIEGRRDRCAGDSGTAARKSNGRVSVSESVTKRDKYAREHAD
jgi:hypothetical protein